MRKLLFLDIDGVLATPQYIKDGLWAIDDNKQELLKQILNETNAEIVLSSTWRKHDLEDTRQYMTYKGFLFSDKIIGVTIRGYHYLNKPVSLILDIPRGVEIKSWIDNNIHYIKEDSRKKKYGEEYTYVILDDDTDMLYTQRNNFIECNFDTGLTEEIVTKAIKILNNE